MDYKSLNMISSYELLIFLIVNLIVILIGLYLWNYIWIKEYGGTIPNTQYDSEDLTYFTSKNYKIFIGQFYRKYKEFDKSYLLRSIGMEAYIYLIFQRKVIKLLSVMAIISFIFSFITTMAQPRNEIVSFFHFFLFQNKYTDNFTSVIRLLGVIIYTFLHFRYFSLIRSEAVSLYFERFDILSRTKDYNWLSSRTLHISGLEPHERNTSILKKKLDLFLSINNGGEVMDIQFIPNYKHLLELERKRNHLLDLKNLINKEEGSFVRKYMFPKIFQTDQRILQKIEEIENKIQCETEKPVFSSGHAFVCFDSLLSADKCLFMYREGLCKKLKLKLDHMWDGVKHPRRYFTSSKTFQKFKEDDLEKEIFQPGNIKILVDQCIEPYDIIWTNVGGDRGLYISLIEKHYTHSRYQYSIFTKAFFYMLFNILIIPGITLSTASYFFITLMIQNGTITPIYYILRLNEVFYHSISPFFAYYRRHFANIGKQWHRKEGDIFQYGYFYALMLVFYTICLVFSSTMPFILIAGLYFFVLKHLGDFYNLLCVHRMEIDSSGYLINKILTFANIPVLFYQFCMLSFFLIKQKFTEAFVVLGIFLISLIYSIYSSSRYILDIYSLHDSLKVYDSNVDGVSQNEINKWRNKFKHPMVLPIHLEDDTVLLPVNNREIFNTENNNFNDVIIVNETSTYSKLSDFN